MTNFMPPNMPSDQVYGLGGGQGAQGQKNSAYNVGQAPTGAARDAGISSFAHQFAGLGINGGHAGHMGPVTGIPMNGMSFLPMHHPASLEAQHIFNNGFPGHPQSGQVPIPTGMPYYFRDGYAWPLVLPSAAAAGVDTAHMMSADAGYYTPARVKDSMPKRVQDSHASSQETSSVPGLDNRRSSYSTNESQPATPFFSGAAARDSAAQVLVFDRSAYTTPSPQQIASANLAHLPKGHTAAITPADAELTELLAKSPAVPRAIPAVFTPQETLKTLEQSLTNHIPGNRNVYIRGLHPTTDDDMLYQYTARFGPVETSKAIIDTVQGSCKGFGFAKFEHVRDSERCIRGFHSLGYEVGFARVIGPISLHPNFGDRGSAHLVLPTSTFPVKTIHTQHIESFNSRLKAEGDEQSTNLYLSNLPKSVSEMTLATIFMGHTIMSCKILRDGLGNSRGVGFARFESREICNEIIKRCNDMKLGEERLPLQIRFADTPAQKELKRVTAERRQFRTNEYNVGAYGTALVGIPPNIYGQPAYRPRLLPAMNSIDSTHDSDSGMQHSKDCKVGQGQVPYGTPCHCHATTRGH